MPNPSDSHLTQSPTVKMAEKVPPHLALWPPTSSPTTVHVPLVPTSGPLHLIISIPGVFFLLPSSWLTPSLVSGFYLKVTFFLSDAFSGHSFKNSIPSPLLALIFLFGVYYKLTSYAYYLFCFFSVPAQSRCLMKARIFVYLLSVKHIA